MQNNYTKNNSADNIVSSLNPISKEEFVRLFNRASDDVIELIECLLAGSQSLP